MKSYLWGIATGVIGTFIGLIAWSVRMDYVDDMERAVERLDHRVPRPHSSLAR